MAAFRTLAQNANESALPGNTKPLGFKAAGVRPGGALTWDWYAAFVDTDGKVMQGGSVIVQWYAVEIGGSANSPTYTTPTNGAPVTTAALEINRKSFGAGLWPWCTVVATPPVVAAKLIYVTIGDDDDGVYSITVTDSEGPQTPKEYDASGKTVEEIRDELVALFAGHPTLLVSAGLDPFIAAFQAATPGYDFSLELSAPGDALTQQTLTPNTAVAASVEIRATVSAAAEVDTSSIEAAISGIDIEGGAAAAITAACAANGAIRDTVRPDGFGGSLDFVNGPDIGGGAARYQIAAPGSGKTTVHFLLVETDKPITWRLQSGVGFYMLGPIAADPTIDPKPFMPGAGGFRAWKTNGGDALNIEVSDRTAAVRVTYFAVNSDDN